MDVGRAGKATEQMERTRRLLDTRDGSGVGFLADRNLDLELARRKGEGVDAGDGRYGESAASLLDSMDVVVV